MASKIITVDKFLGLRMASDGSTELKLGEASVAENFYITDDYNLKTRPGVSIINRYQEGGSFKGLWNGLFEKGRWTLLFFQDGHQEFITVAVMPRNEEAEANQLIGDFSIPGIHPYYPVKIVPFGSKVYIIGASSYSDPRPVIHALRANGDGIEIGYEAPYIPIIVTGASPGGGGENLEKPNLLTSSFRQQFSADGTAVEYRLLSTVISVDKVTVDGIEVADGSYDRDTCTYTFNTAPVEGVNNVEFFCSFFDSGHEAAALKFLKMRHFEAYNGGTDGRIFFYGDGTNVCYYTGVPAYGTGLYIPAGNEIAVDSSASPITGMRRHYTRLMAFKPDGTFSITYEPVTLADGSVIAGFYVRPASRDVGNDMDGQVQTVGNYPRTLCGGNLYEWRQNASYYQDERYAKRIGEQVAPLLRNADPAKIVTCDDDASRTYYMFLNDDSGTVLVNRYELDAWTVYTGEAFKNIRFADGFHGDLLFANDNLLMRFDPDAATDDAVTDSAAGTKIPVTARWETGYLSFGADYRRKYSSHIWVSMLPQGGSKMDITVKTDRRDEYLTKTAGLPLFSFSDIDFANFSFLTSRAPKIQRVKLKVKKFVYYKLIFTVNHPGARATVLGYDQEVRYASAVK